MLAKPLARKRPLEILARIPAELDEPDVPRPARHVRLGLAHPELEPELGRAERVLLEFRALPLRVAVLARGGAGAGVGWGCRGVEIHGEGVAVAVVGGRAREVAVHCCCRGCREADAVVVLAGLRIYARIRPFRLLGGTVVRRDLVVIAFVGKRGILAFGVSFFDDVPQLCARAGDQEHAVEGRGEGEGPDHAFAAAGLRLTVDLEEWLEVGIGVAVGGDGVAFDLVPADGVAHFELVLAFSVAFGGEVSLGCLQGEPMVGGGGGGEGFAHY